MKKKQKVFLQKAVSIITGLFLVFQSLTPGFFISSRTFAQEAPVETPTPTVVPTPEQNNEINIPTPTPEIVTPAPNEEITPTIDPSPAIEPSIFISPEPTVEITPSAEPSIVKPSESPSDPPKEESPPTDTPTIEVTPTITPTITPEPTPEIIEQACEQPETARTTSDYDWSVNEFAGTAETRNPVELGVTYVFPKNTNVSVTFTCLPKDMSKRTTLKIQELAVNDLHLPESVQSTTSYAYDITTGMKDGTFKYTVTLPKSDKQNVGVSYIEKSIEETRNTSLTDSDIKLIDDQKIKIDGDKIQASDINHFTIYIATYSNSTFSVEKSTYARGETVYAKAGDLSSSKYYKIAIHPSGSSTIEYITTCQKGNVGSINGTYVLSSTATIGTDWKAELKQYGNDNSCHSYNESEALEDEFSVTDPRPTPIANPTLPTACCGLDIALVIDNSLSIDSTELGQMKTALKGFVTALSGTPTQFSVIKFATDATVIQSFTSNTSLITAAIDSVPTGGGSTDWQKGIIAARGTFDPRSDKPNLIIFASDGNPTLPDCGGYSTCDADVDHAVNEANIAKSSPLTIRMLALGIGGELSTDNLKAISGPVVNGADISTTDVITTDFAGMAAKLATFAAKTCGGKISVNKYVDNIQTGAGQTWSFTIDGSTTITTDTNGQVASNALAVGTHSITETSIPTGYAFDHASCTNGTYDPTTKGVKNINITADSIITCNFYNTTNKGTIIIQKNMVGGIGSFSFTGNPSGTITTNNGTLTTSNVTPGAYTTTESTASGWSLSSITCDDGASTTPSTTNLATRTATFHVDPGETVRCTFTNTHNAYCGDGHIDTGEECDDGNSVNTDTCLNSCKLSTCGDGFTQSGVEECDDGNKVNTDACTNTCKLAVCGDGIKGATEECDDGAGNLFTCAAPYGGSCSFCHGTTCTTTTITGPYCGDGIINGSEACDGTNLGGLPTTDFSCTNKCALDLVNSKVTICHAADSQKKPYNQEQPNKSADVSGHDDHNGIVWYPGITDHAWGDIIPPFYYIGGYYSGQNWTSEGQAIWNNNCNIAAYCGDGTIDKGEQCDDGNMVSGDGCSATCQEEPGTITFIKDAIPDNTQAFHFSYASNAYPIGDFDLTDDNNGDTSNTVTFTSVPAGTYTWTENAVTGWSVASVSCYETMNNNSSTSVPLARASIILDPGEHVTCTFTNTRNTYPLVVTKFEDANNNATQDAGEPTLDGWTMELYDNETCSGSPSASAVTNSSTTPGTVTFNALNFGQTYWVKELEQPDTWMNTTGNCVATTIHDDARATNTVSFGNYQYGVLTGYKFNDVNDNHAFDDGEPHLANWGIRLYQSNNDGGWNHIGTTNTDTSGAYTFTKLTPQTYKVCEVLESGWTQTYPNSGASNQVSDEAPYCHTFTITTSGQTVSKDFGNINTGNLIVTKFNDLNGNGVWDKDTESAMDGWQINVSGQPSQITGSGDNNTGEAAFNRLTNGTYYVSEESRDGWKQTGITCQNSGPGTKITKTGEAYGHHGNCGGWNGCGDAKTCAQWACEVNGYNTLVSYGADKPCTQFNNCNLFYSRGSVQWNWGNWCPVQGVTDIVCTDKRVTDTSSESTVATENTEKPLVFGIEKVNAQEGPTGYPVNITSGGQATCYIGNQYIPPKLEISKENNAVSDQAPGATILYTLTVKALDNAAYGVKVTDLLPKGFVYRSGSWTASSNKHGALSLNEPTYHSPGTWDVGTMEKDEVITLTLLADIASDEKPGTYKDLALAYGCQQNADCAIGDTHSVVASAVDPGQLDSTFVGTNVTVVKDQQDSKTLTVNHDVTEEGSVLGATTDLPSTGANVGWLVLAVSCMATGISAIVIGRKIRRYHA